MYRLATPPPLAWAGTAQAFSALVCFPLCVTNKQHSPSESPFKKNFFETISDCRSAPLPSLSPPRCFLSCQKAPLQVNSDLRMSSPRGRLRHSLLSFFKRHLSGSLLSALPSPPTPSSSMLLPSSLLPARLLLWLLEREPASLLKGTLVHGPHLLPAPSFN